MADAALAGRCQLIEQAGRRVLVDGAHNGPSLAATLAVAAQRLRPGWALILGAAQDKEIDAMLAVLPAGLRVLRCAYDSPRARRKADWPATAHAWEWCDRVGEAIAACSGDLCISGSLYLAGEALHDLGAADLLPG